MSCYKQHISMKKNSIVEGLALTYIEKLLSQVVGFVVSLLLARMLMPEDYGVIALVNVFINLADVFITSGLGNSLIQCKKVSEIEYSTMLWFSLLGSVVLYVILYLCSPYIASYYGMPLLKPLIRIMALRLPFAVVISVEQAYISRNMLFHQQMIASVVGSLLAATIGIGLAYYGAGAWALVLQSLANSIVTAGVLGIMIGKFPGIKVSLLRFKELFSYGWKLLVTALIDRFYIEVRSLIIGKMFSASDLAYYNKGQDLPSMLMSSVDSSLTRVLFPALSMRQDKKEDLCKIVSRAVSLGTYIIMPFLVVFAFISDKLVLLVLTEKWMPCVPYIYIFCVYYMFAPIKSSKNQAIKAIGRSDVLLISEIVQKIFGVVILLYTVLVVRSVQAIAMGNIVFTIISVVITSYVCKKYIQLTYVQQIKDVLTSCAITLLLAILLYVVSLQELNLWGELILQVFVAAVAYISIPKLLRFKPYEEIIGTLKQVCKKILKKG